MLRTNFNSLKSFNWIIGILLVAGGFFINWLNSPAAIDEPVSTEQTSTEPIPNAQNEGKLKKEAVKADFVELNGENPPLDKKVFMTGEVNFIGESDMGKIFSMSVKEGDGYGIYTIINVASRTVEMKKTYTIYGSTTKKKADDGSPMILGEIIEEK